MIARFSSPITFSVFSAIAVMLVSSAQAAEIANYDFELSEPASPALSASSVDAEVNSTASDVAITFSSTTTNGPGVWDTTVVKEDSSTIRSVGAGKDGTGSFLVASGSTTKRPGRHLVLPMITSNLP